MKKEDFNINISGEEIKINRPEPIVTDIDVVPYKKNDDPIYAVGDLLKGYNVLVIDFYSTGLAILNELKKYLRKQYSNKTYKGERIYRSEYNKLSKLLLIEIRNNEIAVKKAPSIGWLKTLYPDYENFLLSFPKIQGLNSSWQWYINGISVPGLENKIYPWYGTYFPTRFEHIQLFDNWLSRYYGNKDIAFDIGIGSGVLSLQMIKNGFGKVYGTDINPNAIVGLDEHIRKNNLQNKLELSHGNLFANFNNTADLIVFNPPWLPASHKSEGIDKAIYYDETLFSSFFKEASNHLNKDGMIVLLFSNLGEIADSNFEHPIKKELQKGLRFEKILFEQKKVKIASKKTKRNIKTRDDEFVELWVLKLV